MGQDVITCSAVCSYAPHSHAAVEAIPHFFISEQDRPTSVQSWLCLPHVGLEKLISGGFRLTSLMNVRSQEAFSRHFMLYLYSAHRAILVPDWAWSFSSSSAAGTNGCLDLSCLSCPLSGDRSLLYRKCSGS